MMQEIGVLLVLAILSTIYKIIVYEKCLWKNEMVI